MNLCASMHLCGKTSPMKNAKVKMQKARNLQLTAFLKEHLRLCEPMLTMYLCGKSTCGFE